MKRYLKRSSFALGVELSSFIRIMTPHGERLDSSDVTRLIPILAIKLITKVDTQDFRTMCET